jgi:hypothetical protein
VDGLEVAARLVVAVLRPEDPERVLGAVRLRAEQVDRRKAEALRELEDRLVVRSSACWLFFQKPVPNSVQSECMRPPTRPDAS